MKTSDVVGGAAVPLLLVVGCLIAEVPLIVAIVAGVIFQLGVATFAYILGYANAGSGQCPSFFSCLATPFANWLRATRPAQDPKV